MRRPHPCRRESHRCGLGERGRPPARGERAAEGARQAQGTCPPRLGRPAARARLRADGPVGRGDLAAGDAAGHRPLRRHGRPDRRAARRAGRRREQARERDLLADRLRAPGARGVARARGRDGAGDPDRRAVVHQRADHRVHALTALPGRLGRGQPAGAHPDRGTARGRALGTTRARPGHGLPGPLAGGRPHQGGVAGARADPDRVRDPAERRRRDQARAVRRAGQRAARRAAAEGRRDRAPGAGRVVPGRRRVPLAPAPARAVARRDRCRAGDAVDGGRARDRPLRLPRRARFGRVPARRRLEHLRHAGHVPARRPAGRADRRDPAGARLVPVRAAAGRAVVAARDRLAPALVRAAPQRAAARRRRRGRDDAGRPRRADRRRRARGRPDRGGPVRRDRRARATGRRPVTDELGPDHEDEHGHDHGVVGGHP